MYNQDSGLFYIREGEHTSIQKHFKDLRNNRLSNKKPIKNFAYKTAPEQPTFKPKVSNKTSQIANQRRQKLFSDKKVDVVSILLHPNNVQGNIHRLHQIQQSKMEEEERELTYHPMINAERNRELLANQEEQSMGDRNLDLYFKSKVHMKQDKPTEQYEYEKNAKELTFTPQINRTRDVQPRKRIDQRANEIAMEKQMKLQELQNQRKSQFTTSSQVKDGITYKTPIGGREGAHVSPDGKERNQSPLFKRPIIAQQPQFQMDSDHHAPEMEGHYNEPAQEIPENEQSPRYEQPHDEQPMYEEEYSPEEQHEHHDQMEPEEFEPETQYQEEQQMTPE